MEKYFVKQTPSFWMEAVQEFKRVSSITVAAMMMALNTLLGYFKIILIPKILTISFASLAVGACALVCGPLLSGCMAAVADIIKYVVRPDGAFFVGFTLNEFLVGFIYGLFFYKCTKITFIRCVVARFVIVFFINLFFTPLWLYILYGNAFWAMVSARLLKNALMFPIDVALLYLVLTTTSKVMKQRSVQK